MTASYAALLGQRPARRLVYALVVTTLGYGMYSLTVLLTVEGATGSYREAGFAVAAFALFAASTAPLRGRLIDRRGVRHWLPALALGYAAALVALDVAAHAGAPAWVLVLLRRVLGGQRAADLRLGAAGLGPDRRPGPRPPRLRRDLPPVRRRTDRRPRPRLGAVPHLVVAGCDPLRRASRRRCVPVPARARGSRPRREARAHAASPRDARARRPARRVRRLRRRAGRRDRRCARRSRAVGPGVARRGAPRAFRRRERQRRALVRHPALEGGAARPLPLRGARLRAAPCPRGRRGQRRPARRRVVSRGPRVRACDGLALRVPRRHRPGRRRRGAHLGDDRRGGGLGRRLGARRRARDAVGNRRPVPARSRGDRRRHGCARWRSAAPRRPVRSP